MKKIITSAALIMSAVVSASAQEYYERLSFGYGFPSASQTMDGTATPYSGSMNNFTAGTGNMVTYSLKKASYSSGLQSNIAFGYMFNEHVGVDLDLNLMLGTTKYTFNDYNVSLSGVMSDVQIIQQAKTPILITPSLVLRHGTGRLKLYTRLGVVLPLKTRVTQDQIFTNQPGTGAVESDDYKWEVKNKFSLGFRGTVGVEKKIGGVFCLFGEASFLSLSMYASEANLKDVYVNGQGGYLQFVSADQRKVTYGTNFTTTTTDYFHQPTFAQPFSNMAINIGLKINMGEGSGHKDASNKKHDNNTNGYFRR